MTQPEPPKIEFPCAYPIKVLGRDCAEFHPTILAVFERHAPGFDPTAIQTKSSGKGTFISVTITIEATGHEQLSAIHQDLVATGLVSMVI